MQWNTSLLCIAGSLLFLCLAPICVSAQKHLNCWHGRHTQIPQKKHSTKKFCDPFFSNQTAGAVTQKCSSGFYREWAGRYRGHCVPCSCNGLSNECNEQTGNCLNCQFNTTGDRCERCKEGYYGNAANRTCRACPCPFTQNNFAIACLDVGSGVVECLCKRGYSGARCERCTFGYYGNPMVHRGTCKPCNCKDHGLNICNFLTGECITDGNSSCGDHCHECDSCAYSLLVEMEKMDDSLDWLKQQLQNISRDPASLPRLNNLDTNISETKIEVGRYSTAVRHLDPNVEQLEADLVVVRYDLSQLTDETLDAASDLGNFLQNVNGTRLNAEDLLSDAEALFTAIQDIMTQLTELKPVDSASLSEKHKGRMMEEAQRIAQEMRERNCTAQRKKAGSEQEEAHKLLDVIRKNIMAPADSLMASDSSLREVAELLSNAGDTIDTVQGLNLKSCTSLQHLQRLQVQLEKEQGALRPVTEMTKDLLKNITAMFSMLEEMKEEFENLAAQMDGAIVELFKRLNSIFHIMAKVETVTKAEEHAEQLCRGATDLQRVLHNATNNTEMLSVLDIGPYNSIINLIKTAEVAANECREAADQAVKHVREEGLVNTDEGLKDNSTNLRTEANNTESHLKMLSHTVNAHRDHVNTQKEKGESFRVDISTASGDLKKIKRDDTEVLIESAKTAASAANATVNNVQDRLRNISQDAGRITLTNVTVNIDDMLTDAGHSLKSFNRELPVLSDKLVQVEALGGKTSPSDNMTESIRRIKDVIEETRTFVNRLSVATTFNGKGHVELHPPRNLEDIKAFTAVDLLLNRHHNNPSKADHRRKRRQHRHKDANLFVFYLGNKDATGDYIGMAIRNTVLLCVYKLGGVVHEVETSKITMTSVNSSDFDRVIFHRVYQDAEVNITQKFTSQKPVSLPPKRNLPSTTASVLSLDTDGVVFYVGGYPENFTQWLPIPTIITYDGQIQRLKLNNFEHTVGVMQLKAHLCAYSCYYEEQPPVELLYPKYRGAMKLSYINDHPVGLFNYKHAVNMDAKQPTVKIPQAEVSDYYEGTGYRMALIREPDKKKRRLFKFHTNSRETNALLFYVGNEESFFSVSVERGFLVLQGQQAGRNLRAQSAERVSLFDKQFAIIVADTFTVDYGAKQISTDHIQTNYKSYYVGGLSEQLRQRHNITAAPLRGCVDHLTADAEIVEYNRTIGVSDGCPVSLLGVRAATLHSALSVDTLLVWADEQPLRVSLGFRSTGRQGILLKSSPQGSASARDLQLSLDDGFVVFNSYNYTLKSDKRYSDGAWHYLSAAGRPTGLELSIDNVNVTARQSHHNRLQGGKFKGCIANLYARRPQQSFIPMDLSSLPQMGHVVFGQCSLHTLLLPAPVMKRPQKHKPIQTPAGSQCERRQTQREYQLSEAHSWISYTLPQQDLNHRPHFSLDIKTKSSKGLILHVAGRGVVPLLALYIANGKIKMSLGQNRIIQHKERSNDGKWHRVECSVENSTFHLLVDRIRVTDGRLPNNAGSSLDLHNPVYLGGDPKSRTTKGHNIPMNSIISCVRDFKMNEVAVGEPEASHKTIPCFDEFTEMGTYFGGGHIVLDNYFTVGSNFALSFELRPQYLTGLLFHTQSGKTSFNVFLMENKVGVEVNNDSGAVRVSVTPPKSLCDGKFHVVTVSKQHDVIKLVVGTVSEQKAIPSTSTSYSTAPGSLYIGGTTNQIRVPVSSPFLGCLRSVKLDGRPVALETKSRVIDPVSVNRCPAD